MSIYKNVEFKRWKADSGRFGQLKDSLANFRCSRLEANLDGLVNSKGNYNKFNNSNVLKALGQNLGNNAKGNNTPTVGKDSISTAAKKQIKPRTKSQEEAFAAYLEAYKRAEAPPETKLMQNPFISPYPGYFPTYIPSPMMQRCFPLSLGEFLSGRIKFFNSAQSYGFFVVDSDGTDLFAHYDEFLKAGMTFEYIQLARLAGIRFAFQKVAYYGKYNLSFKAVNIQILQ